MSVYQGQTRSPYKGIFSPRFPGIPHFLKYSRFFALSYKKVYLNKENELADG